MMKEVGGEGRGGGRGEEFACSGNDCNVADD